MPNKTLIRLARVEQNLDTILFRRPDDPDANDPMPSPSGINIKPALVAGTAGVAGYGLKKAADAMEPQIQNRIGGLRSTSGYGGFRDQSSLRQRLGATLDVFKDNPGQVLREAGKGIATGATDLYRAGAANAGTVMRGLKKVASVVRASARPTPGERIIALAATLDQPVEFDLSIGDHYARHVGGPIGVAATSRKGKRWAAFKESSGDLAKNVGGGVVIGAGLGAAGAGLVHHVANGGNVAGLRRAGATGALIGALGGYLGGAIRGTHGKRQREIQAKYHA